MRNEQVRITGEEIAIHIQAASEEVKHTEIVKVSDEARNKHRRSGKDNKWKRNFDELFPFGSSINAGCFIQICVHIG